MAFYSCPNEERYKINVDLLIILDSQAVEISEQYYFKGSSGGHSEVQR